MENLAVDKNMKVEDINFATLHPAKGTPGELVWLDIKDIKIDPIYQRKLRREHAVKIAKEWNWDGLKPLSISFRADGDYWCTDGQHCLTAARFRGDIEKLPAYVSDHSGMTQSEAVIKEAQAFGLINNNRRGNSPYSKHTANVQGKDPVALEIQACLDKNGLILVEHAAWITEPDISIRCIAVLYRYHRRLEKHGGIGRVLNLIHRAWGFSSTTLSQAYIAAMCYMLLYMPPTMGPKYDDDVMVKRLQRKSANDIYHKAKEKHARMRTTTLNKLLTLELAKTHDANTTSNRIADYINSHL